MVTTTGYQSGAQRVADTYGIVILELRAPTERDLANRWRSARIELVSRMPQVTGPFPSPVLLRRLEEPVARVIEIAATVSEAQAEPVVIETPRARVAWMLANTLTGSRIWFAEDGGIWSTPD